ncbi:MAG: class I SAM-dependent methyltransferase [Sciscionella sp.]
MAQPEFAVEDVDFEAFYQGKPPIKEMGVSFDVAPWDIGEPQPALVALADSGLLHGEVLDAGCGLGNNSIFLAERGYRVTGVDGSATALDAARQRAGEHGVEVEFLHSDVTTMLGVPARFHTVLDSALYHCLGEQGRSDYAAALHRVTEPGAQLHLFCFADVDNAGFALPMTVSQDNLREHLGTHWKIRSIELADYATAFTEDTLHRMGHEQLQRAGMTIDPAAVSFDEQGRMLARVWQLHAERG